MKQIKEIIQKFKRKDVPEILPGDTVKVYQIIKEGDKERVQVFEGIVLAKKHGNEMGSTITVRKVSKGVGIERIFPVHSPTIKKIEIVKRSRTRRAKLYYLRSARGKRARLKKKDFDKEKVNKETKQEKEEIDKKEETKEIKTEEKTKPKEEKTEEIKKKE